VSDKNHLVGPRKIRIDAIVEERKAKKGTFWFFIDRQGGRSGEDAMSWLLMKGEKPECPLFSLY
jgi:hypothetical protein